MASTSSSPLRALGFCGADDSVHPNHLALISHAFPQTEFGVLFRPDKEGQPRYASTAWVNTLAAVAKKGNFCMRLAAHLCGARVNQVLQGTADDFIEQLQTWGFQRVQINATAVNGVDASKLDEAAGIVSDLVKRFPAMEFILQKNEETQPLWEGMLSLGFPANVSMLVDESKGTGVAPKSWPTATGEYPIGYAGGIGPQNVEAILDAVVAAAGGHPFWIDMESSLRSTKNGKDIFDLEKCYAVIESVSRKSLIKKPNYLI